jgi:formylmethanofuran dehydrogenase subunit C
MLLHMTKAAGRAPASGRFGRYKEEGGDAVRSPAVMDRTLDALMEAWNAVPWAGHFLEMVDENYSAALSSVAGISYSSRDVEKFSVALASELPVRDFPEKAGYFLSALVNAGDGADYVIHTRHLPNSSRGDGISMLGLRNAKSLRVAGPAPQFPGMQMEGGRLEIEGSSDWNAGFRMKGGLIIIHGDGGFYAGSGMEGGELVIKGGASAGCGSGLKDGLITVGGDTTENLGEHMSGGRIIVMGRVWRSVGPIEGGEIHVRGDIGSVSRIILPGGRQDGGKIFQGGKLICPD